MFTLFKSSSPSKLERRIASLGRVFDLDTIVEQAMGGAEVAEYCELSFGAFRRVTPAKARCTWR